MKPTKKRFVVVEGVPDIMSGEQLATEAWSVIKKKINSKSNAVKTTYFKGEIKIVVMRNHDIDTIKGILDNMMEDEFSSSPSQITHEQHENHVVYKLVVPDYIEKWFEDKVW